MSEEQRKRLNELAKDFNNRKSRIALMREFGDSNSSYSGINEDGEAILISIAKDSIKECLLKENNND